MIAKTKYLIIGSGISGLSFVNFLKSDDYLILEKDSTPGGLCRTTYRNGFTWDYSGHFFHFNNTQIKDFFLDRINKDDLVYSKKCTKIFYKGSYIDFPFQKNIHQLPKEDFIDCLYEMYFREKKKDYSSFLEMLYLKFGKGIVERFLKPYNEKLYAIDLNNLDPDAMGRFFPYATLDDVISNFKESHNDSYNQYFFYHRKGAFAFIDALLSEINPDKIHYNMEVSKIDKEKKIAICSTGETIEYDYLICTSPFPSTLKMIDGIELASLSSNVVVVYNLGFNAPPVDNRIHWIYYPECDFIFYRVGFYNNILKQTNMSLYVEIGQKNSDSSDCSLDKVLCDLRKAGLLTDQELVDHEKLVISPAYVHISKQSTEIVSSKLEEYSKYGIYALGRYGKWEYSSIEDAIISAKDLSSVIS